MQDSDPAVGAPVEICRFGLGREKQRGFEGHQYPLMFSVESLSARG